MKKFTLLLFLWFTLPLFMEAQTDSLKIVSDSLREHPKKGYNLGALPVVGGSTDVGVLFGVFVNLFDYGNGERYPKYHHNIYMEVSRTTKGGRTYQLFYDSDHLIKGIRVTADLSYLTEQALPFYGFNGAASVYNPHLENEHDPQYVSRVFYRFDRKVSRMLVNLQGSWGIHGLKWISGLQSIDFQVNPVDIARLNQGQKNVNKLPQVDGLYDDYVKWGLISSAEKHGGRLNYLTLGTLFDTRDNEPNPDHGIWSEAIVAVAPKGVNPEQGFARLAITHRQYFTLIPKRLTFAYRLNWRQTIAGETPFYFLSYQINSRPFSTTFDGLGGANSIRGILRNRLVADGMALANAELRFKAFHGFWLQQNFYVSLTSFYDAGMVTRKQPVDLSLVPVQERETFFDANAAGHITQSAGLGVHIVMNQNFNVAFDFGKAFSHVDGKTGFYISLGYLF